MGFLLFLVSMVILIMEVFYTRLFSVLFWHHTAFAVLSLALLGISASGLFVYLKPGMFSREKAARTISWLLPAFALSLPIFTLCLILLPMGQLGPQVISISRFVPVISLALVPFFIGGLIVSVLLTVFNEQISRLYFWDLCGASAGALSALALLRWCNGPSIVILLALALGCTGAWYAHINKVKAAAITSSIIALLMAIFSQSEGFTHMFDITFAKGIVEPPSPLERWDAVARIKVMGDLNSSPYFQIDSGVITPVLRFQGDFNQVEYLKHNVLQLAYNFGPYNKCVIIGPGGGSDVLSALTFGNKDVTAVEINRSIAGIMQNELSQFNGGLYNRPEVHVQVGEGRGFLAHMNNKVDLIQATFIDTFAAASSGSHTLSENYLYTTDAVNDYLNHLNPNGMISISRFGGSVWGYVETYRVVAIAERTLRQRGVTDPQSHIVVVQGPAADVGTAGAGGGYQSYGATAYMATILINSAPFTPEQLARLHSLVLQNNFRPLWIPGDDNHEEVIKGIFKTQGAGDFYDAFYERTGLDVSPIDDDRPFFFDMLKPVDFFSMVDRFPWLVDQTYFIKYVGIYIIYQVFFALGLLVLILIAIPLILRRSDLMPLSQTKYYLTYFICLGVGFMGVELGLIQRFSLFLGHPIYSLVIVLAALLMFSGLGSLFSNRVTEKPATAAFKATLALGAVLVVYGVGLPPLLKSLISLPFAVKAVVAALVVLPPGFFMGMLFPLGVKSLGKTDSLRLIPWMWGVNSGFSVLASILSLYLSMDWGFTLAWYVFTAVYLLASFCMRMTARRAAA